MPPLTLLGFSSFSASEKKRPVRLRNGTGQALQKLHSQEIPMSTNTTTIRPVKGRIAHGNAKRGLHSGAYRSWAAMKGRCNNPKNNRWPRYGGRGITICERWRKFENFLADMGPRPTGMTLERKNNNGPYEPDNCWWATVGQQARNRRNNHTITVGDESLTLAQWQERTGMSHATLLTRLRHGWTPEQTINTRPYEKRR